METKLSLADIAAISRYLKENYREELKGETGPTGLNGRDGNSSLYMGEIRKLFSKLEYVDTRLTDLQNQIDNLKIRISLLEVKK